MNQTFSRFSMLVGEDGISKLNNSSVIIFGIGGVGSYVVESFARSGVGNIAMVDFDEISESNINRQLHSLQSTIGKIKVEVMKERILDINPDCNVNIIKELVYENVDEIFEKYDIKCDFVVDCIDIIYCKIDLIEYCYNNNLKIISSMGFGNKMHPEMIEISTIDKTSVCPMAKSVRRVLNKKGIKDLSVVYSKERALVPDKSTLFKEEDLTEFRENNKLPNKITPGSNVFVPGTAGLILSSYVIRKILEID